MEIYAKDVGKKFGREWLFRHFTYHFAPGKRYAITGRNGSGKTTLLKLLAATLPYNEGTIGYHAHGAAVEPDALYQHLAWTGPYTGLPPEMTLAEIFTFHQKFKPLRVPLQAFAAHLQLEHALDRPLNAFSSGMKQKLQIGLALFSENSLLLLDEPTANFDTHNIRWFEEMLQEVAPTRTVLISTNQAHEVALCDATLALETWKA